jgi:uncharacterized protein (UPF0335 family)
VINKELEQKSVVNDEDIFNIKSDIEGCKMNLSLMNRSLGGLPSRMYEGKKFSRVYICIAEDKLEAFEKKIKELEEKLANMPAAASNDNNGGADLATLNKMLNDYMKKSDMNDYMKKSDMNDLVKRIEKVEKEVDEVDGK